MAASLDKVFVALADARRRRMLELLTARPGASVGELCGGFGLSRIGAMKHLAVLERAGLVRSERRGRARLLFCEPGPLRALEEKWLRRVAGAPGAPSAKKARRAAPAARAR